MIPKECKRLAEVDFPIAKVSAHSAREKSIRHGHPSTLHLWWARRPLAACRSMLMALLLPDPCDPHCPPAFKDAARRILLDFPGRPSRWDQELHRGDAEGAESVAEKSGNPSPRSPRLCGESDQALRRILLHEFIADFANWDNAANPAYLKAARALVKAAHGDEPPLVVDPFAGGGSIPLEALRIGCDAFASDLNPVACLINKVLLEDIPRHGPKLAEELRRVGAEIKKQAEKELAEFYPPDPDGARPIAYLWARTVRCEQPNCGCEIPLARSWWLCKKASRRRVLRYEVKREKGHAPHVEFEVYTPTAEDDIQSGSVSRAKATCPACNRVLGPDRVRSQLSTQHGGADVVFDRSRRRAGGAVLLAVVTQRDGEAGRHYRAATEADYAAIYAANGRLRTFLDEWQRPPSRLLCPIPDEPLPPVGTLGFRVQRYGVLKWGDLFTVRQKLAHSTLLAKIDHAMKARGAGCLDALRETLGLLVDRLVDKCAAVVYWHDSREFVDHVFARQALIPHWNTAEAPLLGDVGLDGAIEWIASYIEAATETRPAQVHINDAVASGLPSQSAAVWFTDPPYYDAIPYADLSDFFFVWLKRMLPGHPLLRDPFDASNPLTPKVQEAVQDETKKVDGLPKDRAFFEAKMAAVFAEGRRTLREPGIGSVVFAHKTTEGWEALLGGMIRGGWVITGSWPITTEMATRLRARESAALAASVHLVCRPRDDDAGIGDWGEIIRELPRRIGDWMERLSGEGIRGADLVFACIGPALELFSKCARVETPDGEEVGLAANDKARGEPARRGFLSYVWEFAGRTALNQVLGTAEARARNGAAGALEEDARLTALFLWTLQATEGQEIHRRGAESAEEDEDESEDDENSAPSASPRSKGLTLIYDVARRFAQPLGIHLDVWEGRIIETSKGIVRLLPVRDRAKQLFGEEGASAVARKFDTAKKPSPQMMLDFMAEQRTAEVLPQRRRGRRGRGKKQGPEGIEESSLRSPRLRGEPTTLDRVHAAMLLQSSGASNALRALLEAEVDRGPDFLRLANALSALYPRDSEEKRLLDAMLLAVPR